MEDADGLGGDYHVQRDVLDELCLDKVARRRAHSTGVPLAERVKSSVRCSGPRLKRAVLGVLPVLSWLPRYSVRDSALGDLISGISVGIMHLPQGMAYALLASVPPVYGLYTSFYPVLVYFFLGTSRHVSVGTFAVISIMVGSVTERLAPDSDYLIVNGTNNSTLLDTAGRDAHRVTVAAALTVLSGLVQVLLGVVRFGFVVTYLSEPLVRGYTTGAAIHVIVSQLKYTFGISPRRFSGPLALIYLLIEICSLLPQTHVGTLVVSLVALLLLVLVKEINSHYSSKLPLPIPIELIVIVAGTLISYYGNLYKDYAIDVVGNIPSGLTPPRAPNISLFSDIFGDAFAVAIVGFAINISLGKTFALKHGYTVDSNQELVALGVSNTVGGFFQCYSVTSSMSRSLIQESTGGKTQVAGAISAIIVLITVLQLGPLFEQLPKAILSAIVFVNLKGMFKQLQDVPALWRKNKTDLLVWLVTLVCSLLLNLDLGLATSICFSLLTVIFKTQLPRYSVLGQVPGTELYLDIDTYEAAREIPGVTIFRCSGTIYFANAELYVEALKEKTGIDTAKLLTQKRREESKEKRREKRQKKRAKQEGKKQRRGLSVPFTEVVFSVEREAEVGRGGDSVTPAPPEKGLNGHMNWGFHQEVSPDTVAEGNGDMVTYSTHTSGSRDRWSDACVLDTHSIILDMSTASFADTVTVKTLRNIFLDFGEIDVNVYLAACQACFVEELERGGLFCPFILKSRLFPSVHDAVVHSLNHQGAADTPCLECEMEVDCTTQL